MGIWKDLVGTTQTALKIGKAKATLDAGGLTAARTLTLPDVAGTLIVPSLITASPSADQNDYAPTGWSTCTSLFLTPTISIVITGFTAPATGGMRKTIRNDSTDKVIVLAEQSSSSSAANRMSLASGVVRGHCFILPGDSVVLEYDATASRWKKVWEFNAYETRWRYRSITTSGSGTPAVIGMAATTQEGTLTAGGVSPGANFTSQISRTVVATGTTTGSSAGLRQANAIVAIGNAAGRGGFLVRQRWAAEGGDNTGSAFIGLRNTTGAIGNVDASSLVNCIGFGLDPTQSNFRLIKNDASGTATSTDLGTNFNAITFDRMFEAIIFAAPNASGVSWAIWRTDDLTVAPLCGYETTDIPANNLGLTWHFHAGNRAGTTNQGYDFFHVDFFTPT